MWLYKLKLWGILLVPKTLQRKTLLLALLPIAIEKQTRQIEKPQQVYLGEKKDKENQQSLIISFTKLKKIGLDLKIKPYSSKQYFAT